MQRVNNVIGLPVMNMKTGNQIGVVSDLLFDKGHSFQGIVLQKKGLFHRKHFIPSNNIYAIGDDCVMIEDNRFASLQECSHFFGLTTGDPLKGKNVITKNGHQLGQVKDVYFQEEMGTIIGYELSDGFLTDVTEGRKVLRHMEQIKYGKDALVVPSAIDEEMNV